MDELSSSSTDVADMLSQKDILLSRLHILQEYLRVLQTLLENVHLHLQESISLQRSFLEILQAILTKLNEEV